MECVFELQVAAWDANLVTPHKRMGNTSVSLESLCDGEDSIKFVHALNCLGKDVVPVIILGSVIISKYKFNNNYHNIFTVRLMIALTKRYFIA